MAVGGYSSVGHNIEYGLWGMVIREYFLLETKVQISNSLGHEGRRKYFFS
jgi:hypothetical protein